MKPTAPAPELSRLLRVDRVPAGGMEEHIVASPAERSALAARFGLNEIKRLEAFLNVDREEGAMLAVTGKMMAELVQTCVVTLEPLEEKVEAAVDTLFAPPHLIKEEHEGGLGDLSDADPPEPIEGGVIDLGELVAQYLATSLNPYPRKEGASLGVIEAKPPAGTAGGGQVADASRKPFAALAGLMGKGEGNYS